MSSERTALILKFIHNLATTISSASLYSIDHPQVDRFCMVALDAISAAIEKGGDVSLLLIDDELVVDEAPLENNMYIWRLVNALKARGVGHLKITQGVTRQELAMLADGLRRRSDRREIVSSDHVRFGTVEVRFSDQDNSSSGLDAFRKLPTFEEMSTYELVRLIEIYDEARRHGKLRIIGINEIVKGFIKTFKNQLDPLLAVSPIKSLDEYTFTHSTNVCILNLAQAMSLGIEGELLNEIGIAAMLHDMGKLFIPEEVLTKPTKLDEKEWEMVRLHPIRGAMYLLNTGGVPASAVITAFEHHMRYNGTGYPTVYRGWEQHLCSQITAISDVFDALRSNRSYSGSMEYNVIAAMMYDMGGVQLHPVLVRNFLGVLKKASKI
jgi:HD-GYP domain-containing protein (c-di-GMP phosphodiesterase class II)